MAQDRTAVRAVPERRPPPAVTMPPRTVSQAPTASQQLQQRLGNQGTQALLSRTGTRAVPATGAGAAPPGAAVKAASQTDKQAGTAAQQAPASKQPSKPGAPAPAAGRPKAAPAAAEAKDAKPAAAAAPRPHNAIAPVAQAVHQRAAVARSHTPPHAAVGSAQAAAVNPVQEQRRDAATQTVANLDAAKAEAVKRDDFKSRLKQAIEAATPKPKSESEAENVMKTGATQASGALRGNLAAERDAATGPLKSAAASEVPPASQPAPPKTELQTEPAGPPPAPVSAAPVVPAPLPPERLDYSADRAPADQLMAQNKVSKEQLEKGNDPAFGPALAARGNAEKHEATAAARYRQSEGKLQAQTQASAQQALAKDLGGMHGARALKLGKVSAQQMSTMQKNAAERQRITDTINGIKDKTRTAVEAILNGMEDKAAKIFEDGLKRAEQAYEAAFSEAKGGVGTWLTTWGSDWDKHIEQSLATARAEYLKQVSVAIDQVADFVESTLKEAKQRVADGRKEVENFVKGLDDNVKRFGEEALQSVSTDFDAMGSEIEQRRDGLIDKLVQQYKDSYERMSAAEEKLRDENKSLWQRAYDATVGLVKKIIEFKNMLLGVLARAAGVVEDIIADPIGFLGNLVSGVMQGLKNFMSKIGMHLQKGLMDWLFGALGGAGLQLPEKFDLQGIVSIVLQVLGLTYANFRARAVAIVGEPVVAGLEKAAEIFKVIVTEGIPGLWRFIKEKLTDLKSMVLDAIWDFIKERVIIAGITWVIGLLNPASAFFKACKAIYDIVMFFINRGSQIMALVNAIIESMGAIAKGSLGVAATWIENALAKAIPVAIGFLAGLLGLGDVSGTIKKTIDKAQAPVNKAMDWGILQAVKLTGAVGGMFKQKKDREKSGLDGVRGHAAARLKALLGPETTVLGAKNAAKQVEGELAPEGLKKLVIKQAKDGWAVEAEASPISELFKLLPKGRRYSVRFAAKLYLTGEGDPTAGTVSRTGFSIGSIRLGRGKSAETKQVSFAQLFPPDYEARATGIIAKTDHRSLNTGETVAETDLKPVAFATGNTGDAKSRSNSSHAEEQFAAWFRKQSIPWQKRVRRIEMFVTLSPCGHRHQSCLNSLIEVRQAAVNCQYAEIVWSQPWVDPTGETTTTAQDVAALRGTYNRVDGPIAADPDGDKDQKLETTS